MGTPEPDFAPSQFYSIAGTELPLPPSARLDLAYLYTYIFGTVVGAFGFQTTIDGAVYEIPINLHMDIATPSGGGSRAFYFLRYDSDGNVVSSIPTPALQPVLTTYQYDFYVGAGTAYGPVANGVVVALPPMLGQPGEQWATEASVVATNSTWSEQYLQVIRIPTGPQASRPAPAVPSLQLV